MQRKLFSNLFFKKPHVFQIQTLFKFNKATFAQNDKDASLSLKSQGTMIRKSAPEFKGMSFFKDDFVKINSKDFKGKWIVLFFYPLNFTFVCPTEIVEFSEKANEFRKISKIIFLHLKNRLRSHWLFCRLSLLA
jgi:hypothetical protein